MKMFPQSELDNYKLQVELLQEKLQRSEISRQHLEHKLEKLLQKRDEQEQITRSNTKQKYHQFLEEQQRRNERNKQLVQMLERIEQQTEVMNARSERLKMMKLQYEMYFAKLVHLQTKRCVESSVSPVVPMMTTTLNQPLTQNKISGIHQTVVEGCNYTPHANMPMMATHQRCSTIPSFERDQYNKRVDMHTLTNLQVQDESAKMDTKDIEGAADVNVLDGDKHKKNGNELRYFTEMEFNANINNLPTLHLLSKDKELADFQDSPKLSETTPPTFAEVANVEKISQMGIDNSCGKFKHKIDPLSRNDLPKTNLHNESILKESSTLINTMQRSTMNISANNNQKGEEIENSSYNIHKYIPESNKKPLISSLEIGEIEAPLKTSPNSGISVTSLKTETNETLNFQDVHSNTNSEKSSSSTKMLIENIENAIYGELLPSSEMEQEKMNETNTVVPILLENLVTQPETIKVEQNFDLKDISETKSYTNVDEKNKEFEGNSNNENITNNVTSEEYSIIQQNEPIINNGDEYDTYENIDSNQNNKNQQEQEYEYSNYDPTQYSYPGYIYDEATGEYKPDPNAPPEQYATDQQYEAAVYDQQYQTKNSFGYDPTYAQDLTSNLVNNSCENYDSVRQENTSDIGNTNTHLDQIKLQQPHLSELESQQQEPLEQTIENTPEDVSHAKTTKPASILSTVDKNESQKKKKRVNFVDSSEADESVADKEVISKPKPIAGGSSESDFEIS